MPNISKKLREGGPKREKKNNRTSKDEQIGDWGQGNQNTRPEIKRHGVEPDCLPFQTGRGASGSCHAKGVNYAVECGLWTEGNLIQHHYRFTNGSAKSFINKHQARQ